MPRGALVATMSITTRVLWLGTRLMQQSKCGKIHISVCFAIYLYTHFDAVRISVIHKYLHISLIYISAALRVSYRITN
jgi:hypothetical protein